jgi:serine/threonine-protein kinase
MKDDWVELPDGVRQGEDLAGKYRIDEVIGAGASGIVVAAYHHLLGQKIAIKFLHAVLHTDTAERGDAVARFVREAKTARSLQSEHVVRVDDAALLDSGVPYIVMEYLEGADLARTLLEVGPLLVEDAVDYVLQACEAIAEAHRHGVIHRDLKPANLFLVKAPGALPSIKVLDFGISKAAPRAGARGRKNAEITDANAIMGSPFYMSPEQMESTRDVDARTDIWSIGVTLFELLTGKKPYDGHSIVQVYSKIVAHGVHPWRSELEYCPPGLVSISGKCLMPDRDRRFTNVGDLARALKPFGSGRAEVSLLRIRQTLSGSGLVQSSTLDPHTLRSTEPAAADDGSRDPPRIHRRRPSELRYAALAAVTACIALTIGVFARQHASGGRRANASLAAPIALPRIDVASAASSAEGESRGAIVGLPGHDAVVSGTDSSTTTLPPNVPTSHRSLKSKHGKMPPVHFDKKTRDTP